MLPGGFEPPSFPPQGNILSGLKYGSLLIRFINPI